MADDNKNPAGDTERTSILPQTGAQAADQTGVLPTHVSQAETAQMPPSPSRQPAMRLLARPWSPSRDLLPTTYRVTRPWQLAPRRSSLHRRKPRGASARPSPERQLPSSPSASARASLPMPP